ncbi:GPP34 family phosphoprotein [Streptomyces sp. NPDC001594]|uniref:GOLPH3/VPS74 family protein n=1 Tax=Streptomyces sp. NPDC001594 TaxID=3364590 RepID=UPI00367720E6
MGRSRRTIPEELLLLALDPATGTTAQPQSLDLGLAGAQLVELALAGRIAPDGDRIAVVMPRPTGDPTLDSALELLRRRGSPVRAVHWIGGPRLGLRQIYLAHLERCGMVHAVAGQMCGVLPTTRYQATDTAISREIRARLDSAIRTGVPPDPRTAALAALAHAVGLGKHLYPGNEGRSSRSRLRDLIRHDPMGGLVAHAVMDVQNGVAAQPRRERAAAAPQPAARATAGGVPLQPRRTGAMARAAAH